VAGRSPYADAEGEDVLSRVRDGGPASLLRVQPDAPRDLVAIATKAMARDPDGRYPTALEMAEELRSYLTGELVGAYRYGLFELVQRFYERRRAVVLTVVMALAALLASGLAYNRAVTAERDTAKTEQLKAETSQAETEVARADLER